jgi:molybdopterin-guanine dinucleotide biosynthesis protein MobB
MRPIQVRLKEVSAMRQSTSVTANSQQYTKEITSMEKPVIYSVVAYSGTGKTTMLEKLIPELKRRGLRVAVLKHDAHEFEVDREGKDSWRMTRAGADISAVASDTHAAIMENRPVPTEELLARLQNVDVILTEGYKHGHWPKIALLRAATGKPLPAPAEECLAIMTDVTLDTQTPCFGLDDVSALAEFIIRDMELNRKTR